MFFTKQNIKVHISIMDCGCSPIIPWWCLINGTMAFL
jgi:hypothetical protein